MEGKTGSGKDGRHRKEVPRATQRKAQTGNFGCRPLGAPNFSFGCILYAFVCLFRFLMQFSRNGQLGDPSEIIQVDRKFKDNISFLFSVGPEGRWGFAAKLKIRR